MAPKPLALTDGQMSAVMNAAASLLPRDRDAFLRALAVVLHDAPQPLGHGQSRGRFGMRSGRIGGRLRPRGRRCIGRLSGRRFE
jgi:hypothetical protein